MKFSKFFIIRSIFIPLIILGSLAIASIFTHLQVKQQASQFEEVFRTQNVKALAESDIFAISNNLGQIIGKFEFKCLKAKNNGITFLDHGQKSCSPNLFEAGGELISTSQKISIEYVLQLPLSWYYLSLGLILIQAILAIALLILSNSFEKRIIKEEKEKAQALLDQSKQVAHDIRSPLAVINNTEITNELTKQAVQRLNDIAANLLGKSVKKTKSIDEITKQILSEKKLEFPHVRFSLDISATQYITTDTVLLSRILSNLLNNAAEVSKVVDIELRENQIIIRDRGPGIPQRVLDSLDNNIGLTTKADGNGIGLIHAMDESKKLGAVIKFNRPKIGTEVIINWEHPCFNEVILLEDDILISKLWEIESKKINISLKSFTKSSKMFNYLHKSKQKYLFFIDENISPDEKGSEVIQALNKRGYENIYLCTGYESKDFEHLSGKIKGVIGKDFPSEIINAFHTHS